MPNRYRLFVVNSFNRVISAVTCEAELAPENMPDHLHIVDCYDVERFSVVDEEGELEDTAATYEEALEIKEAMVYFGGIYVAY